MTDIPKPKSKIDAIVDPVATMEHLNYLQKEVIKAGDFITPLYAHLSKKVDPTITPKDISIMTALFMKELKGDACLLYEPVLEELVEGILTAGLTGSNVEPVATFSHLVGMVIALQLKPLPAVGRGFFFGEGVGEA